MKKGKLLEKQSGSFCKRLTIRVTSGSKMGEMGLPVKRSELFKKPQSHDKKIKKDLSPGFDWAFLSSCFIRE